MLNTIFKRVNSYLILPLWKFPIGKELKMLLGGPEVEAVIFKTEDKNPQIVVVGIVYVESIESS